jgi:regulatory protein
MNPVNEPELLYSAASYCSTCERCISEVSKKLVAAGATQDVEKQIIERLLNENLINESRFCHSFVSDKFKFNRWGRIRLRYELQRRKIPDDLIAEAINEIDGEAYLTVLSGLLKDKKRSVKGNSEQDVFYKLCRFAAGRGFESRLVVQCLKPLFTEDYDTDTLE